MGNFAAYGFAPATLVAPMVINEEEKSETRRMGSESRRGGGGEGTAEDENWMGNEGGRGEEERRRSRQILMPLVCRELSLSSPMQLTQPCTENVDVIWCKEEMRGVGCDVFSAASACLRATIRLLGEEFRRRDVSGSLLIIIGGVGLGEESRRMRLKFSPPVHLVHPSPPTT
eukprot:746714-Hanusia_phi.AAC.3